MKFHRFLNRYARTSTSLTHGLAPASDPSKLTDQSFSRRQAVDHRRQHVRGYTESNIVREYPEEVRRSVPSSRRSSVDIGHQEMVDTPLHGQRGASQPPQRSTGMPSAQQHRFVEPPSRRRPD